MKYWVEKIIERKLFKKVENDEYNKKPFIKKIKSFLRYFVDDRSRTLDFICLIVFLEVLNDSIYFTKIILVLFLKKK